MKIGYYGDLHPIQRNIIGILPGADYRKVHDANNIKRKIYRRVGRTPLNRLNLVTPDFVAGFNDIDLNRIDLLHFFNTVSLGSTPWVTSFEQCVPRPHVNWRRLARDQRESYAALFQRQTLDALEMLGGDSCKKLIVQSECSLNLQLDFLQDYPQFRAQIERKLTVLHPPQKSLFDSYESKHLSLDGPVHFIFVGSAFFRKGGMEILEVFEECKRRHGCDITLTIVSSLKKDNYATKETEEDIKIARARIHENSDWINYYGYLPNHKALDLMRSAHIGLLPTYSDTYGYSMLEFQAAGCPVISTDVQALPEINNNETGWLIEIPKNRSGEAVSSTKEERNQVRRAIIRGLTGAISEIMEDREIIAAKADAAVRHISDHHSPEEYSRRLGEIYQHALL